MIKQVTFEQEGFEYIYTYSDEYLYIKSGNRTYTDAVDLKVFSKKYTETDEKIPTDCINSIHNFLKLITEVENNAK